MLPACSFLSLPRSAWEHVLDAPRQKRLGRRASGRHSHAEHGNEAKAVIDEVIAEYPGPAQDYRDGKQKALGFLVGQVMK